MIQRRLIQLLQFLNWYTPYFGGKYRLITSLLRLIPNELGFVRSVHGFLFEVQSEYAKHQYVFGCETLTSKVIKEIVSVKKIDVFMDIGANRGWFTLLVRSLDKEAKIFAFEANGKMFSNLSSNIEKNKYENINCKELFIGASEGTLEFYAYLDGANDGMSTAFPLDNLGPTEVSAVVSNTVDNLFKDLESKQLCLLKVDVEGAERDVILGGKKFLQTKPFLILELNPFFLENRGDDALIDGEQVHTSLQKFGYLQFWIDERGKLVPCNDKFLPHVDQLGFNFGANYLFVHKERLDSELISLIAKLL